MNRYVLLAIPAIAIIALIGFAAAQPFWTSPQNMTVQEKSLQLQMLDQRTQILQNQKDYLNGVITQEQFQQKVDQYQQIMLGLSQQMRDALEADPNFQASGSGCPMGGKGYGKGMHMGRGMGYGMMWGF